MFDANLFIIFKICHFLTLTTFYGFFHMTFILVIQNDTKHANSFNIEVKIFAGSSWKIFYYVVLLSIPWYKNHACLVLMSICNLLLPIRIYVFFFKYGLLSLDVLFSPNKYFSSSVKNYCRSIFPPIPPYIEGLRTSVLSTKQPLPWLLHVHVTLTSSAMPHTFYQWG